MLLLLFLRRNTMRDVIVEIDLFIARTELAEAEFHFNKAKKELEEARAKYDYLLKQTKGGNK